MDEFCREINCSVYLCWILLGKYPGVKVKKKDGKDPQIVLSSRHSLGRVTLYPDCIFEEEVTDRKSGETLFYIHFRMENFKHATALFNEMMSCIYENCEQALGKILLCCSSGLTTSFFASQMQALAKLENLNYKVEATGYGMLYEIGKDYDVILLAPQVSYMLAKIKANSGLQNIYEIPTRYFARNDYKHTLEYAISLMKEDQENEYE